ncbi:hypothetical protein RAC89_00225 [Paenibacillus sp. GD4]|jgi:hypothetical protein|uniref:hypothetical protein n=1 Tax=Paenibacillus sp. GD4 TaxID=3068890 RepID=UPI0027967722|nr:hypothetical protein [Paenibacillus sp. GD4]MDQ1908923.1 hypothetical protein [Paenibacillus sp. GD4]
MELIHRLNITYNEGIHVTVTTVEPMLASALTAKAFEAILTQLVWDGSKETLEWIEAEVAEAVGSRTGNEGV